MGILDNLFGRNIEFKSMSSKVKKKEEKDVKGTVDSDDFDTSTSSYLKVSYNDSLEDYKNIYDGETVVSSTINRMANILCSNLKLEYKKMSESKLMTIKDLGITLHTIKKLIWQSYVNRMIYGYAFIRIKNPAVLSSIDSKPIYNNMLDRLGIAGIDPKNKEKEIAVVEAVKIDKYDYRGEKTTSTSIEYVPFAVDEVIGIPNIGRNDYSSKSPVSRVKKYVELKQTFENVTKIVFIRLGAQVCITLGNKDVNFLKLKVPKSFMKPGVSAIDAKTNYMNTIRTNIQSEVNDWLNGNAYAYIKDYGIDVDIHNASSSLPQYNVYLNLFSSYIRSGLLDLFVQGRIDLTSNRMQESIPKDIIDYAIIRREEYDDIINNKFIREKLIDYGMKGDEVRLVFGSIDSLRENIELQRLISMTIGEYVKNGIKVPSAVISKLGLEISTNEISTNEVSANEVSANEISTNEEDVSKDNGNSNDEGKDKKE